jgi:hypothetical protein
LARIERFNVWDTTNGFLELLLRYLTHNDAFEKILRFWLYLMMTKELEAARGKLDELLEVCKDHPITTNSHFTQNSRRPGQLNSTEDI